MDRRVTSTTWGLSPPRKQALNLNNLKFKLVTISSKVEVIQKQPL